MTAALLLGTLIASTFGVASAYADEGGQKFFFRHHVAGISSSDGNPWGGVNEPGEAEEPEIPTEPEFVYRIDPATWLEAAQREHVRQGGPFDVYVVELFDHVKHGEHGISLSCHCAEGEVWHSYSMPTGVEWDGQPLLISSWWATEESDMDAMVYPRMMSIKLPEAYTIGEAFVDSATSAVYLDGSFVARFDPTGEPSEWNVVGDEIRVQLYDTAGFSFVDLYTVIE